MLTSRRDWLERRGGFLFPADQEEVPTEACRLLGFSRTSRNVCQIVWDVLEEMLRAGRLESSDAHVTISERR